MGEFEPGSVVILDERLGRLDAEALKSTFTGTLGIYCARKGKAGFPGSSPCWNISIVWVPLVGENRTRQSSNNLEKARLRQWVLFPSGA